MKRMVRTRVLVLGVGPVNVVLSPRRAARARIPAAANQSLAAIRHEDRESKCVYGSRKVWRQMLREGLAATRCTVSA
jgi:hypothetical protein